jgi:pyridoxine 5-phosphate synthase
MVEGAKEVGTDRIELYTESYANGYLNNPEQAIAPFVKAAEKAVELDLGINAGHDLSLENINYFSKHIPSLLEVSIGHALICESLYLGFENVIPMYLQRIKF